VLPEEDVLEEHGTDHELSRNLPHTFKNSPKTCCGALICSSVTQIDLWPAASEDTVRNISVDLLAMVVSHDFDLPRNPWILSVQLRICLFLSCIFLFTFLKRTKIPDKRTSSAIHLLAAISLAYSSSWNGKNACTSSRSS
jgi:hypothetical protein